ncbi:MAG: lysophospholipid acyltransferase family protein [Burkholderiaceae bacterium]
MSERLAMLGLIVLRAISRLPLAIIRDLSWPVAWLIWALAGGRRRVALTNLGLCFPHWTPARRRQVAIAHFHAFVVTFFERFIFWSGPADRIRQICTVDGMSHLQALAGKPVIVLAPHFVGLDAGGVRLQLDRRVDSMYAQQKSATLTRAMTEGRSRFNDPKMFLRNEGLRGAVRSLRDGVPFYFLPDMDLGAREAVFVPFFGVPAATVTSVARLARLTGATVLPCVTTLTRSGYHVQFYEPWTDYPGDDLAVATRRMNAFIEQRVLEAPEQYLWSHKRFKTRPPAERSFY